MHVMLALPDTARSGTEPANSARVWPGRKSRTRKHANPASQEPRRGPRALLCVVRTYCDPAAYAHWGSASACPSLHASACRSCRPWAVASGLACSSFSSPLLSPCWRQRRSGSASTHASLTVRPHRGVRAPVRWLSVGVASVSPKKKKRSASGSVCSGRINFRRDTDDPASAQTYYSIVRSLYRLVYCTVAVVY